MISIAIVLASLANDPPRKVGHLDHPAITEASGIVASRKHPGIFWVHNDSGNPVTLFAVKIDGTLVREYAVAAPNVDWEDIALDDQGHLYIGDIGNNTRKLPVRAIYRVDEPDPAVAAETPLKVTFASYYRFETGASFDAEGLFIDDGRAIVVTKGSDGNDAELHAVSLEPAGSLLRPTKVVKIGSLPGFTKAATGADLSRDGQWLAVCSMGKIGVYARGDRGTWVLESLSDSPPGQVESICWDGRDLIVATEQRAMFRIPETVWTRGRKGPR